jgi:hypothetical protein
MEFVFLNANTKYECGEDVGVNRRTKYSSCSLAENRTKL